MKKLILTTALVMVSSMSFAQDAVTPNGTIQENVLGANNNYEGGFTDTSTTNAQEYHVEGETQHTTTVESFEPNGYVSNPNLTTGGSDVCLGSSSGGISAPGFGISGGSTTVDENCVMLKNAKLLASIGLKDAATTLLIISNEQIAEAISLANPDLFDALMGTGQ